MFDIHVQTCETLLSDFHKDAYGFRPRGVYPKWITLRELEAEYDRLGEIIHESIQYEEEMQLEAQIEWELRLEQIQKQFGISEADAIRWDMQAEGYVHVHQQGLEHYFYNKGLSFKEIDYWTKKTMDLLDLPVWSEEWEESLAA